MLIITVPTVIGQLIAVYIFYERHWYNVSEYTSSSIAKQISLIVGDYTHSNEKEVSRLASVFRMTYSFIPNSSLESVDRVYSEELLILRRALEEAIELPKDAYLADSGRIIVDIAINNGIFRLSLPPKPIINPTTDIFVLWILSLTFLLLTVSLIFSKNQIRSIIELTSAADAFGRGEKIGAKSYKPSGASEIRMAGIAFIRMRDRIERQIAKRTQMLAMISHDLRTPLTRIKLQASLMPSQDGIEEIERDVDNMEHMIDSYLDFVRGEGGESFKEVDLGQWLSENIKYMQAGELKINLKTDEVAVAQIKPNAMLRAFSNIISNAAKYSTLLQISIHKMQDNILICIEDNGKGISDEEKRLVFKPFFRGDKSRNLDSNASVGLGLTITKEIILGHNGNILLEDSAELKGLMVKIILPIVRS